MIANWCTAGDSCLGGLIPQYLILQETHDLQKHGIKREIRPVAHIILQPVQCFKSSPTRSS